MTKEELSKQHDIPIDIMKYNSLIHSLPKHWKILLKEYTSYDVPVNDKSNNDNNNKIIFVDDKYYTLSKITSKQIYWHILSGIIKPPTSIEKWISEFVFLNDKDFEKYFLLPNLTVKDTKLQTFQYKILNRIFPCQSKLFTWKLAENNKCELCKEHDSITHYFYYCPASKLFWKTLTNWISNSMMYTCELSTTDVIFGITTENKDIFYCLNYILLHGKWFIYRCKLNNKQIFHLDFLIQLKNNILIEKYIYCNNGDLETFKGKWGLLYDALFN